MSVKPQDLYKKENNIFQSPQWLAFQESYGRKLINFDDFSGLQVGLPFGKKAVLVQKAPFANVKTQIPNTNFDNSTIFVRIEPLSEVRLRQNSRLVTKKSLLSGQASPKVTSALDLTKSEEELLAGMKPKTRYNIGLAFKKNVKIESKEDVNVLYDLLLATSKKGGGYFPHEKKYYETMFQELSSEGFVKIFAAKHEGDFLAAILVCFFGDTATYLHGGQGEIKKNLMAPYLCQWEAIKYAKSKGCKYYDFWGVAENDNATDPWAGITRFKEGFGGERIVFPGAYDLVFRPFWYNALTFLAKAKRIIK